MKIVLTRDHVKYGRLRSGLILTAEPAGNYTEMMRVVDYSPYEDGAFIAPGSWELHLDDSEVEAMIAQARRS